MNLQCIIPIFSSTTYKTMGDYVVGKHDLLSKSFESIYNLYQRDGIMMESSKSFMNFFYKSTNDFLNLRENTITILNMLENDQGEKIYLLDYSKSDNDTISILGEQHNIIKNNESYITLLLNNAARFIGLENCSHESVVESWQEWHHSQTFINLYSDDAVEDSSGWNQNIDIFGAKIPFWGIIAGVSAVVGGIGYCVGKYTTKSSVESFTTLPTYISSDSSLMGDQDQVVSYDA